jgi:hypothetical protein
MSQLPTYTFLPWLRQGIANTIQSADVETGGTILRASVDVKIRLTGEAVQGAALDQVVAKQVTLYGPGDIVGIDPHAIVKVEPRHWITNFEPNYLPYIEFYDEDFPWRYTPAAPGAHHRLRPWLMLVVLKPDEFDEGKNVLNKPLPFINVLADTTLPVPDDLWAWAHVHVSQSLNGNDPAKVVSSDVDAIANSLKAVLAQNPDLACSRLLCPRKLEEHITYQAFLVPVFEAGRLAGLGMELPPSLTATKSAWGTSGAAVELPIYHRWQFSTGTIGDFEYLVRLLKPVTANPKVGRRDMDAHKPGANLPEWVEAPGLPDDQKTEGIFLLGGALRAPLSLADFNKIKKYELWSDAATPKAHPFQDTMAALLNLENDYKNKASQQANQESGLFGAPSDPDDPEDLDPVITPPIYGRWHANVQRLLHDAADHDLPNRENWIHELNLDPRFRVAAGFGTGVIQKNQEDYMQAAWKQIGEVLKGNQIVRQGQLALSTSLRWHARHVEPMKVVQPQQFLFLTAPVHRRVIHDGLTLSHNIKNSVVPPAMVSAPMRRLMRPQGRLMKNLAFSAAQPASAIVEQLNTGQVFAAPQKKAGKNTPILSKVIDSIESSSEPTRPPVGPTRPPVGPIRPPLRPDVIGRAPIRTDVIGRPPVRPDITGRPPIRPEISEISISTILLQHKFVGRLEGLSEKLVEQVPRRRDFRITMPTEQFQPAASRPGDVDSPESALFRKSIADWAVLAGESGAAAAVPPKTPLDLASVHAVILDHIHPLKTIPSRVMSTMQLPSWLVAQLVETFDQVMAYPKLDVPMYKPLEQISSELLLPNIRLIENNTISLLKTNQKFIESYMVGLNHEFARELLWREYPTDQRGSCFRQFWDVSTVLKPERFPAPEKENEQKWREKLYDIPAIHTWNLTSKLGTHDNRELPGQPQEEEVVLAIRGELLKKYPNAVIYAHKADWATKADGSIDKTKIRKLTPLSAADEADLDDGQVAAGNKKVQTPLYSAKVAPDIHFFGFNLTVEEVQGAKGDEPDAATRPGWFFVIKERPGEPRFGLDIDKNATLNGWNDLSWHDVKIVNGTLDVGGSAPDVALTAPVKRAGEDDESFNARKAQFAEDHGMAWSAQTNSAELAYILYQVPVLVAVHGSEMLPADLAPGEF